MNRHNDEKMLWQREILTVPLQKSRLNWVVELTEVEISGFHCIREPIRSNQCNGYGHIVANCTSKIKFPRRQGEPSMKECSNKESERRCATCESTSHHTGQAACPQRKIAKEIILRATKHISYAKAREEATSKIARAPGSRFLGDDSCWLKCQWGPKQKEKRKRN